MMPAQTQAFIGQWHRIFEQGDPALILPLIHDEIEFYSPAIFQPKRGKHDVFELLCVVFEVLEGYRVTDTWTRGHDVMFEFEARVGPYTLQGIDRFRLDDAGKVVQMKVWIRPLTGLQQLARAVMRRGLDRRLADRGAVHRAAGHLRVRVRTLARAIADALR